MKEPISLRLSDSTDPDRGAKFEAVLLKRCANPSCLLRGLVDAYIEQDGDVEFPVTLVHSSTSKSRRRR